MKQNDQQLTLTVKHDRKPEQQPNLKVYLFSQKRKLLETSNVKSKQATFKTLIKSASEVRVLIAPDHEQVPKQVTFEELKYRFKAYEPVIQYNAETGFDIQPIPAYFNDLWFWATCRVRGEVTKMFEIHGTKERRPLCDMRVHICEVDRIWFWLPQIPDDIIKRIPDIVFNPELPIPQPIPEPPRPLPDPPPFLKNSFDNIFNVAKLPKTRAELSVEGSRLESEAISTKQYIANDRHISSRLLTYDPNEIRSVIRDNFNLFHPLLCYTPWIWPYFYSCDEVAVAYTDMNGLFESTIWYQATGDHPDLYFWVEAMIDGEWTTVYKPPIPCNTYWNYECGSQVNINVTDPRVMWGCDTVIPGEIIWVKTVGHGTSVHHIQQNHGVGSPVQGSTYINRIGLTDKHEATGNYRRPFGKGLYFILQFSSGLPKNKYTYYRWSYRKIRNADLSPASGTLKTISNPQHKPYTFEVTDSIGHLHFKINHFKLGPQEAGGEDDLFLIPPPSPYDAPVNASETNAHWDQNTRSVSFDSASLDGDGLYEFWLELFDKNGNKVTDIPNELFQIPHYDSFSPSVNAPAQYLSPTAPGKCDAFKMVMRIDNAHCEAAIYKLEVDGETVDPGCCGFVPYADLENTDIEISFRAYHPNNFADFSFNVNKGTCGGTAHDANGMVISSVDGYTRNMASIYRKTVSPAALLGDQCKSEGKAAFAEHLHVDALATNGNSEIDSYNASALAAFALEPGSGT